MSHGGFGGGGGFVGHGGGMGGHHSGGHHMGGEPDQSLDWNMAYQGEKEEGGWGRASFRPSPAGMMGLLFLGLIGWLFVVYASSHAGKKSNLADLSYFPTNKYQNSIRAASGSTPWQRDSTARASQPGEMAMRPASDGEEANAPQTSAKDKRQEGSALAQASQTKVEIAGNTSFSAAKPAVQDWLGSSPMLGKFNASFGRAGGDGTAIPAFIPSSAALPQTVNTSGNAPTSTLAEARVGSSAHSLAQAYAISQLDGSPETGTSLAGLLVQSRPDFDGVPGEVTREGSEKRQSPNNGALPPGQVTHTQSRINSNANSNSSSNSSTYGLASSSGNRNPYVHTMLQSADGSAARTKLVVSR